MRDAPWGPSRAAPPGRAPGVRASRDCRDDLDSAWPILETLGSALGDDHTGERVLLLCELEGLPVDATLDDMGLDPEATSDAHALADAILMTEVEAPMVVGILGGWGSGKSFVLHLLREQMRALRMESVDDDPTATPLYVGHPYLINFTGRSPFARRALDVRTYAMAVMRRDYSDASKADMPKHWLPDRPHTHVALDDAIEQGELFCNMLQESRGAGGG